jgi:hypothetical protein
MRTARHSPADTRPERASRPAAPTGEAEAVQEARQ